MSFLRHRRSIKSLSGALEVTRKGKGRDPMAAPFHRLDESQLAIPGRLLSSRACFRFTNRGVLCRKKRPSASKIGVETARAFCVGAAREPSLFQRRVITLS